jgi:hypothetical protein
MLSNEPGQMAKAGIEDQLREGIASSRLFDTLHEARSYCIFTIAETMPA